MIVVTYRDLKQDGFFDNYELENIQITSGMKVIKDNIIPGMFGYPDMYIRKFELKKFNSTNRCLIVSYTDYELTETKKREIIEKAIELINNNNPT